MLQDEKQKTWKRLQEIEDKIAYMQKVMKERNKPLDVRESAKRSLDKLLVKRDELLEKLTRR